MDEPEISPVFIESAEHYRWGAACDGWFLMRQPGATVIEERMPPGTFETLHLHHYSRQFFYVLSGEATFTVEGKQVRVSARQGIEIPPEAAHNLKNEGSVDLEFLVFSHPPSHGDRIEP